MTRAGMAEAPSERTRRTYARVAGFCYLLQMVAFVVGEVGTSMIRGSGDVVEVAGRVLASEHLYRAALSSTALGAITLVVLAHSLYVLLEPVNRRLAQLALWARLGEAFIVGAVLVLGFTTLGVYAEVGSGGAFGNEQLHVLRSLAGSGYDSGFLIWMLFFSLGSTLFFYLFYTSRTIPRPLAALGIFGSVLQVPMSLVGLIFPAQMTTLQYLWAPIFLAEVGTGLWLLIAGVRPLPSSPAPEGTGSE